jgi:hypothetical protein
LQRVKASLHSVCFKSPLNSGVRYLVKRLVLVIFATASLCGCASQGASFDALVQAGAIDLSKPHGKDYENAFFAQAQSQPPKGVDLTGCPETSKPFSVVLVVNSRGRIVEAHSSPESNESKCVAQAFMAHDYPSPPFSPFRIVTTWGK